MPENYFKIETIRKTDWKEVQCAVYKVNAIPMNKIEGLRGYKLSNVRIERSHIVDKSTDYNITCDLDTPKRIEATYKRVVFNVKNKSSGTDQFLYIGPECQIPDKTREILRPAVLQVLTDIIKCLESKQR